MHSECQCKQCKKTRAIIAPKYDPFWLLFGLALGFMLVVAFIAD